MKHLFVPYELVVKLKEKGFNEECVAYYVKKMSGNPLRFIWEEDMNTIDNTLSSSITTAPLYQQVIDWFREKHNIIIELLWQEGTQNYSFCYGRKAGKWFFPKETFEYYQAIDKAIEEALKLIP